MYHFTALVTLLAVMVYFYSSILVSRARGKFGVKLPAISGNPDFERVFRAQMNTLEWMPIFLPSLWLFAIYIGDGIAAARAGLGDRPHSLCARLCQGGQGPRPGLCDPGAGCDRAVGGSVRRHRVAVDAGVRIARTPTSSRP
jgi:MAPEG family